MTDQTSQTPPTTTYTPTYCAYHPKREANLRCNRCDQPICTECAVLTPTGYRCKECVRSQQKIFDTAKPVDYVLAFVVAVALSYVGSVISSYLGFFSLFIAPVAGVVIAEAIRWVVRRRRSKALFQLATAGTVLGALPHLVTALFGLIAFSAIGGRQGLGGVAVGGLLGLIWPVAYVFLAASTVYYRLRGIQIR